MTRPSDLTTLPIFHADVGETTTAQARPSSPRRVNGSASTRGHVGGRGLDWGLVRSFRRQAAELLAGELDDQTVSPARAREIGWDIARRLLAEHAEAQVRSGDGGGLFTAAEQDQLATALFDSLFGLGRLQPLVDDESIENIEVRGHDHVTLVYSDGVITNGPPVADSDEELLEQLQFLASRSGVTGRPFSPADPPLDLRLHGGHRLAASAWTTPRPSVVIRRHRHVDIDMAAFGGPGVAGCRLCGVPGRVCTSAQEHRGGGAPDDFDPDVVRLVDALRGELGERDYLAAYDRGRVLDRASALALLNTQVRSDAGTRTPPAERTR